MRLHSFPILLAFAAGTVAAQTPPAGSLADALAQGKVTFNARLRWEHAEQSGLRDSDALTLRSRLGFTTAPFNGVQGMVEGRNVASLGDADAYNAAGTNAAGVGRTVIADPTVTDVNQAWLSYTASAATVKGGRQRLVLDMRASSAMWAGGRTFRRSTPRR